MTQLPLPVVLDVDPRIQLSAARRLQRIVDANKRSFECEQFRRRRATMLSVTRPQARTG